MRINAGWCKKIESEAYLSTEIARLEALRETESGLTEF
jgi:hypothetical protein